MEHTGPRAHGHNLLAVPSRPRLKKVLRYVLDESEFLSPFGVRSPSKVHQAHPYVFRVGAQEYRVDYSPGESNTFLFGGNSNWRGSVWFPINYLLIEALESYHHFYGDDFLIECPTGSGNMLDLKQISQELVHRLTQLFAKDASGVCPYHGDLARSAKDPHWKDLHLFFEYFHGDSGQGLGASHQTGWTALVTRCMEKMVTARDESLVWPSTYY